MDERTRPYEDTPGAGTGPGANPGAGASTGAGVHRALLIGASAYDDHPRITSLPFVPEDLQRLADALRARGFASAEIPESPRGTTPNFVTSQLTRFLRDAEPHDLLLIVLSGHGMHHEGADYLIPEDAALDVPDFEKSCVRLDWSAELERTRASQVVFLVDACREGVERDAMSGGGPPGLREWGDRKIAANLRRKVAYVYACSPGELALYVRQSDAPEGSNGPGGPDGSAEPAAPEGDSFSLFSRAVCDVVRNHPGALDLARFEAVVQRRLTALHSAHAASRPPQHVRVRTDIDKPTFTVLPGPARDAREHAWVRAVARHAVWERVPEMWRGEAKARAVSSAAHLAERYDEVAAELRDDPWHDAELAERTCVRTAFLIGRMRRDESLSPTEAGLIALLPLAGQALWAREAARRPLDPSFVQGHPRLKRRLADAGHVPDIEWWLRHRAALRRPDVYAPDAFKGLLGPSGPDEGLSPSRLVRLLKDQRSAPFGPPGDDLTDGVPVAPSTAYEHEVRERLVAAVTKTGHALAIDPVDLPEVVVEHVGISDSVDLAELLRTVRRSEWIGSGVGRALSAVCGHPAVQIALQQHAGRVDELLRALNGTSGRNDPVASLPPFANPDRVRLSGNTPADLSSGIRFHLAEDRVQELLMGEGLYGDVGLAVREMYQNALDACRHREARTAYLRRTGAELPPWEGRISFTQGVDESGRPYLDCVDNGIGMGVDELSHTFSQGGSRFVDLPEYVEESAEWARLDPPVEHHPNSRFGIGVLSYFMLADEITVHTCRLDRDGRPAHELKVTIAGPGNLFRVEDLGPGRTAGTRVRLHLPHRKARFSCVDELLKVLWVAPFRVDAEHGSLTQVWEPGVLCDAAVRDRARRETGSSSPPPDRCVPSVRDDVWWSTGGGLVLADGLAPGREDFRHTIPHGVVVNLTGADRVELSVDRRRIHGYDSRVIKARAMEAVPSIRTGGPEAVVDQRWLTYAARQNPVIADAVAAHMEQRNDDWLAPRDHPPFTGIGFFPVDVYLWPLVTGKYLSGATPRARVLVRTLPSHVLRWRLSTLLQARHGCSGPGLPAPVPARPSDLCLLTGGHLSIPRSLAGSHADPLVLAEWVARWLERDVPVTAGQLFARVRATGHPAAEVARRLAELGHTVPSLGAAGGATEDDLDLLVPFHDTDGWLTPGASLSLAQISYSAARAEVAPAQAADRLRDLGFGVPGEVPQTAPWDDEDADILRTAWRLPSHTDAVEVPTARVVHAAHHTGSTIAYTSRVLRKAGFLPDGRADHISALSPDDHTLLSGIPPVEGPVPPGLLWERVGRLGWTVERVTARLRELGHDVPNTQLPWHTADPALLREALALHAVFDRYQRLRLAKGYPVNAFELSTLSTAPQERLSLLRTAQLLQTLGYAVACDLDARPSLSPTLLHHAPALFSFPLRLTPSQLRRVAFACGKAANETARALRAVGVDVPDVPREDDGADDSLALLAATALRERVTLRQLVESDDRHQIPHDIKDWFA